MNFNKNYVNELIKIIEIKQLEGKFLLNENLTEF